MSVSAFAKASADKRLYVSTFAKALADKRVGVKLKKKKAQSEEGWAFVLLTTR